MSDIQNKGSLQPTVFQDSTKAIQPSFMCKKDATVLLSRLLTPFFGFEVPEKRIQFRIAGNKMSENLQDDLKAAQDIAKEALKSTKEGMGLIAQGTIPDIAMGTIQTITAAGQFGSLLKSLTGVFAYTAEAARQAKETFAPEHAPAEIRKSSFIRQGLGILHYVGNPEGSKSIQEFNEKIMRNIELQHWLKIEENPSRARISNVYIVTVQFNKEQKQVKLAILESGEALLLMQKGQENMIRFYSPILDKSYEPSEELPIIVQGPALAPKEPQSAPLIEKVEDSEAQD